MERWRGRIALVTGASVGIGAEVCCELTKHGMKVIGCARSVEKIKALAEKLPEGSLYAIKCDLQKEEDILSMFEEIREKFGRIDVCINNAGFSSNSPLLTGNTEDWRAMFDVTVLALCICTREAVKLMRENNIDDGQIIHISSMAAHRVVTQVSFYSGMKFMVRALAEGLRKELRAIKSHIRVACISPGLVKTEFMHRMFHDDPDKVSHIYSSMQCLTAADIASMVINVLQTPPHVDVNDILIRPVEQEA